ncbi:hypothetical protein SAMN05421858_1569 [Haladaptatus litoreus]|uniref:Uncharacterized protein n=1 Tax=Haladaptatus litoreus TaxID=553468 RepID=A0A1N6YHG1_9EURY|nr:hypothetical protein [Haladaptatus litoreus]SIR14000.1 hypothetical protein SAMN05421858_1569 [Haladaptatus litoreus]
MLDESVANPDDDGGVGEWVLLSGNRFVLTAGICIAVVAILAALTAVGAISVGFKSAVRSLLSSGIASGLLTLITVALSINQLILSRVFGSPNELTDRLDGTLEFRQTVEEIAGRSSSPTDPTDFLALVFQTIHDRTANLNLSSIDDEAGEYQTTLASYAETIGERVQNQDNMVGVLSEIVGTEYAEFMAATRYVRNEFGDELSESEQSELEDIFELLKAIAIARQYFKTLAIQQDLARLSRFVAYSGLAAFVTTICLTLLYKSSSGAYIGQPDLSIVVILGFGIIVSPLAVLIAYILRVATIARYTVSVGPFVPPKEEAE